MNGEIKRLFELPEGWTAEHAPPIPWSGISIDVDEGTAVYVAPVGTPEPKVFVTGLKGTTITTTGPVPGNILDDMKTLMRQFEEENERQAEANRMVYMCPAADYEQRRRTLACDLLGLAAQGKPRPRVSLIPSEHMRSGSMVMFRRGAVTFEGMADPVVDETVRRYAL